MASGPASCIGDVTPELRVYSGRRFIRISPLFAIGLALAKNSADEVPPMPQAKVMLLRTGSTFKIVGSDCGQTISKRLENEHAAYCHADLVVQHQATCPGEKMSWVRHLLRITAS